MKKLLAVIVTVFTITCISAQNTGVLQIQIDTKQMAGTCNLSGADSVYLHSGLGWSNPDSIWQSIVGNWGIDNGKGEMTNVGNGVWSICFNVRDYYTDLATQDSTSPTGEGYGPMPSGVTPYNIGIVFRKASCPYSNVTHHNECTAAQTGKDENCDNLYILRIDQPLADSTIDPANVIDAGGLPYAAMTARYITVCEGVAAAVDDLHPSFRNINIYPLPFSNTLNVQFNYAEGNKPTVEVFDLLGKKIADLTSAVHSGQNNLMWNGKNAKGDNVAAGFYMVQISNGDQKYTGKIIKQ